MKSEYIGQIAEALQMPSCASAAPVETVFVCGSRAEGRRILSAITAAGTVLTGVHPETPFTLAQELCAIFLAQPDAPRFIEGTEAAELIRSCMDHSGGVFSGVNAKSLAATDAIFRTFQEMTMAGVPFEEAENSADSLQMKELRELHGAYLKKKKERNLIDRADLLVRAVEIAESETNLPLQRAHYVVIGDYAPAYLERRLLKALAGEERLHAVNLPCADFTDPENGRPFLPWGAMADGEAQRVDAVELLKNGDNRFVACRGTETEVRFPLRDILEKGRKPEDCAVVYLSGSYAQPLYEEAARFNIPVAIGGGLPLSGSLLYTTLKQVHQLPLSDFYAEDVCNMLSFGALSPRGRGALAEHLRRKKVGWGKERYLPAVEYKEEACPDGSDKTAWEKEQARRKEKLQHWHRFLELMLDAAQPAGDAESQRKNLLEFLPFCNHANQREAAAMAKTAELISHITQLEPEETVLSRLLSLMENASYLGGKAAPGTLYCAPLAQAAGIHRKHLYIVGFSRYAVQGTRRESPILPDSERKVLNRQLEAKGISGKLITVSQRGRENEFRLRQLIVRHEGDITLTYPDFESSGMLVQEPAPLFKEAAGDRTESVTYIHRNGMLPVDALMEEPSIKILPPQAPDTKDIAAAALQKGMTRKEQMQSIPFSATMLEEAARCPYAFYLRRLLKIRAPQPVKRNPEKWLDAAEVGTFCHSVLEHYYMPNQNKSPEDLFNEEYPSLLESTPLPRAELEAETRDRLLAMLKRAVEWVDRPENADGYGRSVLATEKWFQDLPMDFTADWTLQMQGSIDRVDMLDNGDIAILDYKTGDPLRHREESHKHWQHYLYARAQEMLDPSRKVQHAGYFFLNEDAADGDMLLKITEDDEQRDLCAARIAWVLDQVTDEKLLPECLPCYEPYGTKSKTRAAGELKKNKKGRSVALKQCSNWCEFASICPEQKGGFDND